MEKAIFGILLLAFAHPALAVKCELLKSNWPIYLKDLSVEAPEEWKCDNRMGRLSHGIFHLHAPEFTDPGINYYKWAKHKIKKIRISEDEESGNVADAQIQKGLITLYPYFFSEVHNSARRASTLVHETRHLEKEDPGHVTCNQGAYKGEKSSCDAELFDGNSQGSGYNFNLEYLTWIKNGSSYSELSEEVLQTAMNKLVPDRFNKISSTQIKQWRQE